ncbi:MAG: hypothetical protein ABH842_00495 [Candidatus Micrarchaeota archaeon]
MAAPRITEPDKTDAPIAPVLQTPAQQPIRTEAPIDIKASVDLFEVSRRKFKERLPVILQETPPTLGITQDIQAKMMEQDQAVVASIAENNFARFSGFSFPLTVVATETTFRELRQVFLVQNLDDSVEYGQSHPLGTPESNGVMATGGETAAELASYGGTYANGQPKATFVAKYLEGRSKQEQEDGLRAALQLGFGLADVSEAAKQLGITQSGEESSTNPTMRLLALDARERAKESLTKLISEQKGEDERRLEREKLAKLLSLGPNTIRAAEEALRTNKMDDVLSTLDGHIGAVTELHSGNLNLVVPKRTMIA